MKTYGEIKEMVVNGTAQLLTIEYARENSGKNISVVYSGYNGQDGINTFIIGCVKSEYEMACENNRNFSPHKNQAEYWESYMTKEQLEETKNTYCLLANDGRNTFIKFHKENNGIASCSDIDRYVYFVEE